MDLSVDLPGLAGLVADHQVHRGLQGILQAPVVAHADKAYDHCCCRALRRRGICPRIARRMVDSSARLGRHRWTIERTGAWLGGLRRLRIRYERSSERFNALVILACSGICFITLRFITLRQRHGEPFPECPEARRPGDRSDTSAAVCT